MRQRDARKARTLMEQHILASADHLIEILEERGASIVSSTWVPGSKR